MKYVMTAALALSLMAGGVASAQDRRDDHGGGRPGGGAPHGQAPHGQPQGGQHGGAGGQRGPGPGAAPHGPPPGAQHGGPRPGGGSAMRPGPGAGGPGRPGPGPGRPEAGRPEAGRPEAGRPGGGRPGGAAFNGRPGSFLSGHNWHATQRFRGPSYRYPRGYGYQRWAFGAFLPSIFLAPDYTLSNYWAYGLPAPPPGFHWIRVGPDALLVRYGDGYVLDAAYGLFY